MIFSIYLSISTRMIEIQLTMSERAVELLCLPEDQPCHILDLGCGSGLSGETLSEQGHTWTGVDISSAMLSMYQINVFKIVSDKLVGSLLFPNLKPRCCQGKGS